MESIFNLEESERSSLLQQIIQSFGFTYICLWSHFPHPSNCLIFIDGIYKEENNQLASSSSSLSGVRSFQDYQKSIFLIDNYTGGVPGFAFMNNVTYMDRKGLELLGSVSNSEQLQFYQEARIKTAIFMGCKNGEIELGMSNASTQNINFENELKKMFPGDFPQDQVLSQQLDQARASSSSSSLRSLSMENSADYPPFLFNMLQTTSYTQGILGFKDAFLDQQAPNQAPPSSTMRPEGPLQQALNQIRTKQLIPSREHEEAAMTRAILAAISSSSNSSPSSSSSHKLAPRLSSAFKRYRSNLGPIIKQRSQIRPNLNRRSLSFFRNIHKASQAQQDYNQVVQTTRPTSNQLHHMISERKRREKLNDSFQALRSLLPPGSKKDKASVLSNTKEYLASLKSQVEELSRRNKILEAKHLGEETVVHQDSGGFSGERLTVGIMDSGESTSESSRVIEVEVNARGESILMDLVGRILKFIKQIDNLSLVSIDARTRVLETEAIANRVVLRLRIHEGSEWDISGFQEAVRRVLDDLAQ